MSKDTEVLESLLNAPVGQAVQTRLETDEQVIARVTDGIYRQPASAFRELIANSYDADATVVSVKTDAPRFKRITIEDDGVGMNEPALINLLHHIGGSAKRSDLGATLGVTSETDPDKSPGGRRLIGRIGIGLFSVSQLTRSFHIITKSKGAKHRLLASVTLRQFDGREPNADYESGIVKVWRETSDDIESHGTTIVLDSIRETARQTLASETFWASIKSAFDENPDSYFALTIPKYYTGSVTRGSQLEAIADLPGRKPHEEPWRATDAPSQKFRKLVDSVWEQSQLGNANIKLDGLFDTYYRILWQLGLALPLPYVDGHPFDQPVGTWEKVFTLSNRPRGMATQVPRATSVRGALQLEDGLSTNSFDVTFDGVLLARPLRFKGLPTTHARLKKPLLFVGKCEEQFAGTPVEFSAGPLRFEAYFLWAPKILPVDHQGALIRIFGASGTLFDTGFFKYQTAEIVRMRQISCEIYVQEGLEGALNIDRESLNEAHPHTVFLTQWIHNALRQVTSTQKRLAAEIRLDAREEEHDVRLQRIASIVDRARLDALGVEDEVMPMLVIARSGQTGEADYVVSPSVFEPPEALRNSARHQMRLEYAMRKTEGIGSILAAYGLLESLSAEQRSRLLQAVYELLCEGLGDES